MIQDVNLDLRRCGPVAELDDILTSGYPEYRNAARWWRRKWSGEMRLFNILGIASGLMIVSLAACSSSDSSGTGGAAGASTGGSGGGTGATGGSGGGSAGTSSGGTGGGSAGAGGSAGGGGDTCTPCVEDNCAAEVDACNADADCTALLDCVQACSDTACITECQTAHPGGATLFADVFTCTQQNCAAECGLGA